MDGSRATNFHVQIIETRYLKHPAEERLLGIDDQYETPKYWRMTWWTFDACIINHCSRSNPYGLDAALAAIARWCLGHTYWSQIKYAAMLPGVKSPKSRASWSTYELV